MDDFKSELHYYLREKYWHKSVSLCNEELKKGRDPYISFWRGFASSQEGALIEAIRDAEALGSNRDFQYSSTVAMIAYYNLYPSPDASKVKKLIEKQSQCESSLTSSDAITAMRFFTYLNDEEKYTEIADKLASIESAGRDDEEMLARGWKNVFSTQPEHWKEAQGFFQKYIKKNGNGNIDALLGGLKCLERMKGYEEILNSYQEIIKSNATFLPFHIERIKIYLIKNDYESAVEYINSRLANSKTTEVYKIATLCSLMQDGEWKNILFNLNKMWDSMLKEEPKNPDLYYKTAMLFGRTCDKNEGVMKVAQEMIDKAIEFNPRSANYLIEKANVCLVNGDSTKAEELFTQSTEIDSNNKESVIGLLQCKIIKRKYKEALDDISFLKEMSSMTQTKNAKLLLFEAIVQYHLGESEEKVLTIVKEALKTCIEVNKAYCPWNKYEIIISNEYDFLYDMAKVLLDFYDFNSQISVNNIPETLKQAQRILGLLKKNRYFTSAHLLNSKLMFILSDSGAAMALVEEVLQVNSKHLEALMMKIIICIQVKDFTKAKEVVNEAIINNRAETKENASFLILKSKCELGLNDTENSQKTLNEAITVFDKTLEESTKTTKHSLFTMKKKDKLELLKLNIDILLTLGKTEEAQSYMNKLIVEFQDLGDELLMLHTDLALKTGDVKKAVNLLRKVGEKDEKSFKQSRIKLSQIYLNQVMNRRLYSWCYTEILEKFPSFENLKLAGNALMDINSPDEAVDFYKQALKFKNEMGVMRDLGRALVKTHDYQEAIKYYVETSKVDERAINNQTVVNFWEMCNDFVDLMYKLNCNQSNKVNNSMLALKSQIEEFVAKLTAHLPRYNDHQLKSIYAHFKYILSMVDKAIYLEEKKTNKNDIFKSLEESVKFQKEVLTRLKEIRNEEQFKKQRVMISNAWYEMGQYYEVIEVKPDLCEKAYVEAVNNNAENSQALYCLSNLYLKKGQYNEAQRYVEMLLHEDESNEDALALLISILNAKKSNEASITYLETMIGKQPHAFHLIELYLDIIYRCGKISNAKDILYKCDRTLKYTYTPGLYYCKGLYYKYLGEINKALIEFSKAKTDEYYGIKCLEQMLEIYINPDGDIMRIDLPIPWTIKQGKGLIKNPTDLDIEAIQFLLRELKIRRDDDKTAVFEAYVAIVSEDEAKIEEQCRNLQDIVSKNQENLSVWIALIMSKLVLKNINEVKSNLKIMDNYTLNIKYHSDYERGLLILAYLMMMTDNDKKAEEYIKKVLQLNVSQIKAYEYLAMLKEKQNSFQEACAHYEKAWDYSNKNNANIGYKLAVSYLNSKNNVKALNICNEIKRKFPAYPIDEIATQAKNSLN